MRAHETFRERLKDNEGSTLVEFAVSVSIVIALLFWIFYASMALYADHFTENAARAATRYAMVRGSTWGATCSSPSSLECTATGTDVSNYVKALVSPGLDSNALSVTTTWPGTTPSGATCETSDGNNSPYCEVMVQVTYNFNLTVPFLPYRQIGFSSAATAPITE